MTVSDVAVRSKWYLCDEEQKRTKENVLSDGFQHSAGEKDRKSERERGSGILRLPSRIPFYLLAPMRLFMLAEKVAATTPMVTAGFQRENFCR